MKSFKVASLLSAPLLAYAQATHSVDVGKDGNTFSPNSVNATAKDVIRFTFYKGNHSVAQATFDAPCRAKDQGVFSGYMDVKDGQGSMYFDMTVNNTDAIWLYSSAGNNCQDGMVMVINQADQSTSLTNFEAAAKKATSNSGPSDNSTTGGVLVSNENSAAASSTMTSNSGSAMTSSLASSASSRASAASSLASAAASNTLVTGGTATGGAAATGRPEGSSASNGANGRGVWGAGVVVVGGVVMGALSVL